MQYGLPDTLCAHCPTDWDKNVTVRHNIGGVIGQDGSQSLWLVVRNPAYFASVRSFQFAWISPDGMVTSKMDEIIRTLIEDFYAEEFIEKAATTMRESMEILHTYGTPDFDRNGIYMKALHPTEMPA